MSNMSNPLSRSCQAAPQPNHMVDVGIEQKSQIWDCKDEKQQANGIKHDKTSTLQIPRLPALDPAYLLTCSNLYVTLAFVSTL